MFEVGIVFGIEQKVFGNLFVVVEDHHVLDDILEFLNEFVVFEIKFVDFVLDLEGFFLFVFGFFC